MVSMVFTDEAAFEDAVVEELKRKGWGEVLDYPTEQDLLENWANILSTNNQEIDRLDGAPLTGTEMAQIIEQITALRTPVRLNGFINGKTVSITRDNPDDPAHLGKEVSLKIYDRNEIAAGQSRYQIARQPRFSTSDEILGVRRGDLLLLINGMPVIHIELKKSGIDVKRATNQIEKYAYQGVFSGLYSLIQVFVGMTPTETVYFANPGPDGSFNPDFFFHWADFNNEPVNKWDDVVAGLLSIPMAHELIGFYTVADASDGILKVMRSYQYWAARQVWRKVIETDWSAPSQLGGYVWHTTGSGKTMTSFKSAQLISGAGDANKVVFLMDRIELGTQSLREYRGFAAESDEVQETENTNELIAKLKDSDPSNTLIVTSIQKLSRINDDAGLRDADIEAIRNKRMVIIVDEAHRSTFGDMLSTIKRTFPQAVLFGFTGTPIHDENQRKQNTTATIFGDELHRYSIADGIRDGNVLGFDPYKVETSSARVLRKSVALRQAGATTEEEALGDPQKQAIYHRFMDSDQVPMAGQLDANGKWKKGVEDYLPPSQYDQDEHRTSVAQNIADDWLRLSRSSKFHALFATHSIREAILYYRLFKDQYPHLKVAALFDPNIDNDDGATVRFKQDGLVEILRDYNSTYGQNFTLATFDRYKKDVAARLAHKEPHRRADLGEERIDLLIVVDQMLTGFDSRWVNTLYLDKVLRYESIIQAFSRTNRLFGDDKPFGTIKYYRKPATMEHNVRQAIELYSGHTPLGLFVNRLHANLEGMNRVFGQIKVLFVSAGVADLTHLPEDPRERGQFAKQFSELNRYLEAALIQGFHWDTLEYEFDNSDGTKDTVRLDFNEETYNALLMRYKELGTSRGDGIEEPAYGIESHLTEIDTGKIDSDYLDSKFEKYIKALNAPDVDAAEIQTLLDELHASFATLTQEEQKWAKVFLHDVRVGDATLEDGKTFKQYIADYQHDAFEARIAAVVDALGVDEDRLRTLLTTEVTEKDLNSYGRFDALRKSVDLARAQQYLEALEGKALSGLKLNILISQKLKGLILEGEGFEPGGDPSQGDPTRWPSGSYVASRSKR